MNATDWLELIKDCYAFTARATARNISIKYPQYGKPEGIRKKAEFIQSWSELHQHQRQIDDLIRYKCDSFTRRKQAHELKKIIKIAMGDQPIAILHFGDPHLDDNGCNWPLLKKHHELARTTPRLFAGNIGDTINNWVGKLEKLYAKQHTTFDEALSLTQWFIKDITWFYWVLGNHDHWNNGAYILDLLLKQSCVYCYADHDAKVSLVFDNGVTCNLHIRHDWKGHSMYMPSHGVHRSHIFGSRWSDFSLGGHTHQWSLQQVETEDGVPRIAARVRGYKFFDGYAEERGFYEHQMGSSLLTIIDPFAPPVDRIKCFWDIEYGVKVFQALLDSYK